MTGSEPSSPTSAGVVLVVCTGNVARSPYIERRLAQLLDGSGIEVSSAGTAALVGRGMEPDSADWLEHHGADASDFRARQLTAELVRRADLVICAAREHRAAVVTMHPAALRYTATLVDLTDLLRARAGDGAPHAATADAVGSPRSEVPVSQVSALARRAVSLRGLAQPRSARQSDIADPFGRGPKAFAGMVDHVEGELHLVADALRSAT